MTTLLSIDTRTLRVQRYVGRTIDNDEAQLDPHVPGETREDLLAAIEAFRADGSVTEPATEDPPNDRA
jgi:hypothetical protein